MSNAATNFDSLATSSNILIILIVQNFFLIQLKF